MPITDDQIRALLDAAAATRPEELDCEAFLAEMAAYAEARAAGRPVDSAFVRVAEHEARCANCREECRALIELVRCGEP